MGGYVNVNVTNANIANISNILLANTAANVALEIRNRALSHRNATSFSAFDKRLTNVSDFVIVHSTAYDDDDTSSYSTQRYASKGPRQLATGFFDEVTDFAELTPTSQDIPFPPLPLRGVAEPETTAFCWSKQEGATL
ncbi:hypothetical protein ACLKA7_015721 [Drosophila subpalustris]